MLLVKWLTPFGTDLCLLALAWIYVPSTLTVPTAVKRKCWASCNTLTSAALNSRWLAVRNAQIEASKIVAARTPAFAKAPARRSKGWPYAPFSGSSWPDPRGVAVPQSQTIRVAMPTPAR